MPDATPTAPELALILHPEDEARFVAVCEAPSARGPQRRGLLYAVLHRRHGAWTHLYRVVPDALPGGLLVYLEKAWPGERLDEAADWALQRFVPAASLG
jgi:hypothetical protein